MIPLLPLRYAKNFPECRAIPGQKLPRELRNAGTFGTPRNCRRLLTRQPAPAAPISLTVPDLVRPWVGDFLLDYQKRELARVAASPGHMMIWACGSGKSLAAYYAALLTPGPIVFVCRGPARPQMRREAEHYTFLQPMLLEGMTPELIPPVQCIILGWETLPAWVEEIEKWRRAFKARGNHTPCTVIFDELHKAKSWKQSEKGIDPETGKAIYREINNISSAAARLGRLADKRLGLTATPVPNDRSDLWAQLNDIEPYCWGTNWDFVHRYCDAKPGQHGGIDTTGESETPELQARLAEVWSVVTKKEALRGLPPARASLVYLRREDQNPPAGGFAKLFADASRMGKAALLEVKLLESATRKRAWVLDAVDAAVEGGQKVTVFTGRRADCERLAAELEKKLKSAAPVMWAHGGVSEANRDTTVQAYRKHEGPIVLVATGDSMGESIDGLQVTDLVLFVHLPYTPRQVIQQMGRFTRRGQTTSVHMQFVVAQGTVDEHVADILLGKLEAVGSLVEDGDVVNLGDVLSGCADEEAVMVELLKKI